MDRSKSTSARAKGPSTTAWKGSDPAAEPFKGVSMRTGRSVTCTLHDKCLHFVNVPDAQSTLKDVLPEEQVQAMPRSLSLDSPMMNRATLVDLASRSLRTLHDTTRNIQFLGTYAGPCKIFIIDTEEHIGYFSVVEEYCKEMDNPITWQPLEKDVVMKDFILCILECIAAARKIPDQMCYVCIPDTLYSEGPLLKVLVERCRNECPNVRMISTARALPKDPLDGRVVTYLTSDEFGAEKLPGSFIVPERDVISYPLNLLLGVAMIKLASNNDDPQNRRRANTL